MDKNQKEFTDQIRSAIKTKLSEINAFVDDELPDYIMILVANKRSKSQIAKDLSLFLGDDTVKFTDWLWDMIKSCKLKGKSSPAPKKIETKKKTDQESEEDNDVLDCDVSEHGSDILEEEVHSQKRVKIESTQVKDVPLPQKVSHETKALPDQEYPKIPFISSTEKAQVFHSEDEYDPTKPHFSGCMSSVVQVSPKNYARPASLQPNKLLLRAVNDATKSVLNGLNVNDFYKPTPINVLSSNKKQNHARYRNLVSVKIDPDIECSLNPNEAEENNFDPTSDDSELQHVTREYPSSYPPLPILNPELADASGFNDVTDYSFHLSESEISDQKDDAPHFIVTLDGVDYSLKRKYSEDSDEAMDVEEDESILHHNEDSSGFVSKKLKLTKCKFWPSCFKKVDECDFFHPTVPCKTFPECKFGDQCLYIHPDCKFDALCSRKDCPFTHASKRKFSFSSAPKPPIKKKRVTNVCKFYPNCTASNCPFIHPKPCRYGTKCRSQVCSFTHYNVPARDQLIWKANV